VQRLPRRQFHHQSTARARFPDAVNLRDIRMIGRRQDLGFTLESSEPLPVLRRGSGQVRRKAASVGMKLSVPVA